MQTYLWLASLAICRICCLAAPLESDAAAAERRETAQEVLRRYAAAAAIRQAALKGVDMDVTIHARLLRLNKEGLLQAVRHVACNGQVSYRIVNFLGDGTIRREAIARYLAADIEASHDRDIALTASHYEFRLIATPALAPDGRQMRGFRIKPKQKRAGLFKGEVWFDEETGMAVRELGQFVKNPSVYLRKLSFVRDYEIRDGISVPHRIQSTIETRIAGRLELTVLFSNFAYSDAGDRNCQDGNAGQWRLAAKRETGR